MIKKKTVLLVMIFTLLSSLYFFDVSDLIFPARPPTSGQISRGSLVTLEGSDVSLSSKLVAQADLEYDGTTKQSNALTIIESGEALQIHSNFDSASIESYTINANEINFTLITEDIVNTGYRYTYWTNFKVSNVLNKEVTFKITNAYDVMFLTETIEEAQMVYSYDGENWNRITNHSYSYGIYTFTQTFTSDEAQIATFFPFSYTNMSNYVDTISLSEWATKTVLGLSEQGRDIDLLTITNTAIPISEKKVIYIIGRQHAAETASSHMLKGMIDFLISDDTDAQRMMNHFVWYIVPMVNPDGVYSGKSRATSKNRDPNRDWHDDNHNSVEIDIVRGDINSKHTAYGIDFFIDWHSQMMDDRWHNFIYSPLGNTFFSILSSWTDFDSQEESVTPSNTISSTTATGYIRNNVLNDPTFTFEPTPHLVTWTEASLNQQGEYVAFAIDEYFLGVTVVGDVNGDGVVDDSDLSDLSKAYGSKPGDPNWNPNCDFNGDNKVDASDLFDLSKNYGKTI